MKAFLTGFGIGAVVAMLIAPKRGSDLRSELRERLRRSRSETRNRAERERPAGNSTTLNTVTREQLLSVYGIGAVLADRIIENRPYDSARDVVERGIISEGTFSELENTLLRSTHKPERGEFLSTA